jgi:hypothetical protein
MAKKQTSKAVVLKDVVVEQTPMSMISHAIDKGATVETLEKMFALQERWEANQAKKKFDKAMSDFQAKCPVIKKNKDVFDKQGKLRYSYSSLDSIVSQTRKLISEVGLSYRFANTKTETEMVVECIVTHIDGHSQSSPFTVTIGAEQYMTDTQKMGARSTFAKRYAFCDAFGIMTGDEDNDACVPETDNEKINVAIELLNKCTTAKTFNEAWNNLPKESKANKDVISCAKDVKELILQAK